jgi:hypothetical protein
MVELKKVKKISLERKGMRGALVSQSCLSGQDTAVAEAATVDML